MRLDHYIATYAGMSRRKAKEVVVEGRVSIDGIVEQDAGEHIAQGELVVLDGKQILPLKENIYVAIYKPRGYVSSAKPDMPTTKVVLDLLPSKFVTQYRVYPVGRLDKDSEGLLVISNDGELTNILTHPRYEVEKEYQVVLRGLVTDAMLASLRKGVKLRDGMSRVDKICCLERSAQWSIVELVMHEGRKHQIRRMFAKLGVSVHRLIRIRVGTVSLGTLRPGKYRLLKKSNVYP